MIYETAEINVIRGKEAAFEAGVEAAAPLFKAANGCLAMELRRGIEDPLKYYLVVQWATVENHVVEFRQSAAFGEWRKLVSAFFAAPPTVAHSRIVVHGF